MSEATSREQQPTAQAGNDEISDESLEAVSGGLSLYNGTPTGGIVMPTTPVTKPTFEPVPGDPVIRIEE